MQFSLLKTGYSICYAMGDIEKGHDEKGKRSSFYYNDGCPRNNNKDRRRYPCR